MLAIRRFGIPSIVIASMACLFSMPRSSATQQTSNSSRRVVDIDTRMPIAGVAITAWPEWTLTGKDGTCPRYGNAPVGLTESNREGIFTLSASQGKTIVKITYCSSGYNPRTDKYVENPEPDVQLYSLKAFNNKDRYRRSVKNKTIALLNELEYLRSVDPENFKRALDDLVRQERVPVEYLNFMLDEWSRPRPK